MDSNEVVEKAIPSNGANGHTVDEDNDNDDYDDNDSVLNTRQTDAVVHQVLQDAASTTKQPAAAQRNMSDNSTTSFLQILSDTTQPEEEVVFEDGSSSIASSVESRSSRAGYTEQRQQDERYPTHIPTLDFPSSTKITPQKSKRVPVDMSGVATPVASNRSQGQQQQPLPLLDMEVRQRRQTPQERQQTSSRRPRIQTPQLQKQESSSSSSSSLSAKDMAILCLGAAAIFLFWWTVHYAPSLSAMNSGQPPTIPVEPPAPPPIQEQLLEKFKMELQESWKQHDSNQKRMIEEGSQHSNNLVDARLDEFQKEWHMHTHQQSQALETLKEDILQSLQVILDERLAQSSQELFQRLQLEQTQHWESGLLQEMLQVLIQRQEEAMQSLVSNHIRPLVHGLETWQEQYQQDQHALHQQIMKLQETIVVDSRSSMTKIPRRSMHLQNFSSTVQMWYQDHVEPFLLDNLVVCNALIEMEQQDGILMDVALADVWASTVEPAFYALVQQGGRRIRQKATRTGQAVHIHLLLPVIEGFSTIRADTSNATFALWQGASRFLSSMDFKTLVRPPLDIVQRVKDYSTIRLHNTVRSVGKTTRRMGRTSRSLASNTNIALRRSLGQSQTSLTKSVNMLGQRWRHIQGNATLLLLERTQDLPATLSLSSKTLLLQGGQNGDSALLPSVVVAASFLLGVLLPWSSLPLAIPTIRSGFLPIPRATMRLSSPKIPPTSFSFAKGWIAGRFALLLLSTWLLLLVRETFHDFFCQADAKIQDAAAALSLLARSTSNKVLDAIVNTLEQFCKHWLYASGSLKSHWDSRLVPHVRSGVTSIRTATTRARTSISKVSHEIVFPMVFSALNTTLDSGSALAEALGGLVFLLADFLLAFAARIHRLVTQDAPSTLLRALEATGSSIHGMTNASQSAVKSVVRNSRSAVDAGKRRMSLAFDYMSSTSRSRISSLKQTAESSFNRTRLLGHDWLDAVHDSISSGPSRLSHWSKSLFVDQYATAIATVGKAAHNAMDSSKEGLGYYLEARKDTKATILRRVTTTGGAVASQSRSAMASANRAAAEASNATIQVVRLARQKASKALSMASHQSEAMLQQSLVAVDDAFLSMVESESFHLATESVRYRSRCTIHTITNIWLLPTRVKLFFAPIIQNLFLWSHRTLHALVVDAPRKALGASQRKLEETSHATMLLLEWLGNWTIVAVQIAMNSAVWLQAVGVPKLSLSTRHAAKLTANVGRFLVDKAKSMREETGHTLIEMNEHLEGVQLVSISAAMLESWESIGHIPDNWLDFVASIVLGRPELRVRLEFQSRKALRNARLACAKGKERTKRGILLVASLPSRVVPRLATNLGNLLETSKGNVASVFGKLEHLLLGAWRKAIQAIAPIGQLVFVVTSTIASAGVWLKEWTIEVFGVLWAATSKLVTRAGELVQDLAHKTPKNFPMLWCLVVQVVEAMGLLVADVLERLGGVVLETAPATLEAAWGLAENMIGENFAADAMELRSGGEALLDLVHGTGTHLWSAAKWRMSNWRVHWVNVLSAPRAIAASLQNAIHQGVQACQAIARWTSTPKESLETGI